MRDPSIERRLRGFPSVYRHLSRGRDSPTSRGCFVQDTRRWLMHSALRGSAGVNIAEVLNPFPRPRSPNPPIFRVVLLLSRSTGEVVQHPEGIRLHHPG